MGGGMSPFCTEELVCHQHLRLPFLQLGRKSEVWVSGEQAEGQKSD